MSAAAPKEPQEPADRRGAGRRRKEEAGAGMGHGAGAGGRGAGHMVRSRGAGAGGRGAGHMVRSRGQGDRGRGKGPGKGEDSGERIIAVQSQVILEKHAPAHF